MNQISKYIASEGYSLPYALILTLIITTLLFAYLSIDFFNNYEALNQINKRKLDLACQSAIQYILSDSKTYPTRNQFILDSISVEVVKKENGLFNNYFIKAKKRNDSSKVLYTVASKIPDYAANALIITKPNLRLTVAGNTEINGNILATSDKVSKGNIFGIKNSASQFLNGKIIVNPNLNLKLLTDSTINKLFAPNSQDSVRASSNLIIDNNFVEILKQNKESPELLNTINYFTDNECRIEADTKITINIYSKKDIIINGSHVVQNMNLYSEGKIIIGNNCTLKNVQFYSKTGIISENSIFNYPTILGLYINTAKSDSLNNSIDLKSSLVNGTLLLVSDIVGLSNNESEIRIDKESKVQGFIYCENNLELLGELDGTAYTYSTYFYKEPTKYINWLVDMKIERNKLNHWFCLPIPFADSQGYETLKETWIY